MIRSAALHLAVVARGAGCDALVAGSGQSPGERVGAVAGAVAGDDAQARRIPVPAATRAAGRLSRRPMRRRRPSTNKSPRGGPTISWETPLKARRAGIGEPYPGRPEQGAGRNPSPRAPRSLARAPDADARAHPHVLVGPLPASPPRTEIRADVRRPLGTWPDRPARVGDRCLDVPAANRRRTRNPVGRGRGTRPGPPQRTQALRAPGGGQPRPAQKGAHRRRRRAAGGHRPPGDGREPVRSGSGASRGWPKHLVPTT